MSDNTTTIEITDNQKAELKSRKQHERESFKSVIARLLGENKTANEPVGLDIEALAKDRQEQLEEVVHSATGDLATNESVQEVASQLKDLETEIKTLRDGLQR